MNPPLSRLSDKFGESLSEAQGSAIENLHQCPSLPECNLESLASVRDAFKHIETHSLQQAWLDATEPGFAPASVRFARHKNQLLVLAELKDMDIIGSGHSTSRRLWEAGDVFEIFLCPLGQSTYSEFQITPDNRRLHLRYLDSGMLEKVRKSAHLDGALMPESSFESKTWVNSAVHEWVVFASIPVGSLSDSGELRSGNRWRFSFSRYDYTRGRQKPVISSTSPHAKPDFHRQHEWGTLCFD